MTDVTALQSNESDDSKLLRWWAAVLMMAITVSFAYIFATDAPDSAEAASFGAAYAAAPAESAAMPFHQQYNVKTAEVADDIASF